MALEDSGTRSTPCSCSNRANGKSFQVRRRLASYRTKALSGSYDQAFRSSLASSSIGAASVELPFACRRRATRAGPGFQGRTGESHRRGREGGGAGRVESCSRTKILAGPGPMDQLFAGRTRYWRGTGASEPCPRAWRGTRSSRGQAFWRYWRRSSSERNGRISITTPGVVSDVLGGRAPPAAVPSLSKDRSRAPGLRSRKPARRTGAAA
jgi:hypothetical protein